ncbi:MAG: MFS transporter [Proteobacteria bacterium]|nr:MFS transporter [Pseudomonadota bacterium]MDA1058925.1 MFS transporter [Pseudomonadota bacterium]
MSPPATATPTVTVPYLMVATMVSVVAATIYVPSLPSIVADLGTSPTLAQFSLTAFVLTFGIVQLWHGPASDRLGRYRVLAGSLVVFIVGTAVCAVAPSIEVLIVGRMLQGLGAAGVGVLPRAIARDQFGHEASARVFTYLSMAASAAATASPVIGGGLEGLTGSWRLSFVLLGLFAAWVLFLSARRAPFLAAGSIERPAGLRGYIADYWSLMRRAPFAFNVIGGGFLRTGFYAFIVSVPFVLTNMYGTSVAGVGVIMMTLTGAFLGAYFIVVRIAHRFRPDTLVVAGTAISMLSPVALALLTLTDAGPVVAVSLPVALFGFGNGFAIPMANALAVGANPRMAGAGSSLLGFWAYTMGAGGTVAAGLLTHDTALPLAILLAIATTGALACFVVARIAALRSI